MIEFFLKRRVLTNLITLFIVAVGGYQAFTVRREAFPDITFDILSVQTSYPGASPEEVESQVTRNVERELKEVSGIERVESWSVEHNSVVIIRLDDDLSARDAQRAVNDVYQAVNRVRDLPPEAEKPLVREMTSARPLITVSVAGGTDEVRERFSEEMKDMLEALPGVARVEGEGDRDREIWIELDPEKLRRHRVTVSEVAAAVKARNVDVSAGTVVTGPKERYVRISGAVQTAVEFERFIVRGSDERAYVRVGDVGRARETFAEARVLTRADGRPAVHLKVLKHRSGDAIRLTESVRRLVAEQSARATARGIRLVLSDDFSFFIKRRLKVMTNNMVQGGFLILGALFLFLDWRLAVVAAWGVPISFAAAMMIAVPLGFTINLLSLLGFIIVLGMLDDDSVVVAENIYRHLEAGEPPERAAVAGCREVALPVLGSVLVSSCAFLPFAMMSGIMGKFLFMIPVIVCMAFLASVFEAFFILPSHVLDLLPFGRPVEESRPRAWYAAAQAGYTAAIRWVLRHKLKFLGLLGAFIALTVVLALSRLKMVLFPPGLIDQAFVQVDMPVGSSLDETSGALSAIERLVLELPPEELEAVTATVGLKGYEENVRLGTHYGQVRVFLTPEETRPRKTKEILAELRRKADAVPGPERVVFDEVHPGPPVGRAVVARVRGRDLATLGLIAERVKTHLRAMPGARDVQDSREGGKGQVRVVVDDPEAAFAGLDYGRVAQSVLLAVDGGEVSKVRRPDEEVKVKVRLDPASRGRPDSLLGLEVPNPQGRQVALGRVARLEERQGPPFLGRYDFKPVVTVTADVDVERITSREANARLKKAFRDIGKEFPGYDIIYGGEEEQTQESLGSLFRAFGIALLLDFVILAALFRSYSQPFIILTTIPIGLVGVVYALFLHGAPASFMALLGVVAMTGVVINNAIVLVNFINANREAGLPLEEAVVRAGADRLRAIGASSITTLLGLFPTAYGFGGYEPFVAPMALALAWGLTLAMPMTLFLIPAAYVLVEDMKAGLARRLPWGRGAAPPGPAPRDTMAAGR